MRALECWNRKLNHDAVHAQDSRPLILLIPHGLWFFFPPRLGKLCPESLAEPDEIYDRSWVGDLGWKKEEKEKKEKKGRRCVWRQRPKMGCIRGRPSLAVTKPRLHEKRWERIADQSPLWVTVKAKFMVKFMVKLVIFHINDQRVFFLMGMIQKHPDMIGMMTYLLCQAAICQGIFCVQTCSNYKKLVFIRNIWGSWWSSECTK